MNQPYRCGLVALMGPPNAGKSTLTNALVGHKVAIVTSKPQTTRNRITGILTTERGQAVLMDTPGVNPVRQRTRGPLGKIMNQTAWQSFSAADVVMVVVDADLYLRHEDFLDKDLGPLLRSLADEERPVVVVVNKVDLFHDKSRMLPLLTRLSSILPQAEIYPLSALRRDGIENLRDLVLDRLPEGPARYPEDQLSTVPVRFMAAEIVREKLFESLYEEVPYSVAVEIEDWDEPEGGDRIVAHAAIYVARPSHKAMVIGRGGQGIKAIGSAARREIVDLTGKKVRLELWVKVREDWTDDTVFLHDIGFGMEDPLS